MRDQLASVAPTRSEDASEHTTSLVVDAGSQGLPYDRVTVVPHGGYFSRSAEVFSSSDSQNWTYVAAGVLSRTTNREDLSLVMPEPWTRYLKLTIQNGDDQPLQIDRLELSGIRRTIVFASKDPGEYLLYSGNPNAHAPSYDLAVLIPDSAPSQPARLQPPQNNHDFQSPLPPWSDRNRIVLNVFLCLAVVIMGFVTLRYFIKVKAA
jgi:hypothetical protein